MPRPVPVYLGHTEVLFHSPNFAASAHVLGFVFMGITVGCLEVGMCPSSLLAPEGSAGHPQAGSKAAQVGKSSSGKGSP